MEKELTAAIAITDLPSRSGPPPRTNPHMPHQQLTQTAPLELQETLFGRVAALPGIVVGRSHVSVRGTRAFHLQPGEGLREEAFMVGTEFAHLHPPTDSSMHLVLPEDDARMVIEKGWGEFHPMVLEGVMPPTNLMVYGPRDAAELETVWLILLASYANARRPSEPAQERKEAPEAYDIGKH